uniref:C-type lectin domain-containing protein n=1 Tax=Labrus bergylta TaxID=56723 RepID=A0A3Q3FMP3_9LABR
LTCNNRSSFTSDSHCDSGYLLYGDFCYQFETEVVKSWQDAEAHCAGEQAHLVSVHSEEELSVIQLSPTGISLWMGGHDSVTEGGWEWVDGSPFRYIRWSAEIFKNNNRIYHFLCAVSFKGLKHLCCSHPRWSDVK